MSADRIISADAARTLQAEARESREPLTWIVSVGDCDQSERIVARPVVAAGRGALPVLLAAATLCELRAQLPPGLNRFEPQAAIPLGVLELWH